MRALAVVPTYNEIATLQPVVEGALSAAREADVDLELLVVDDDSPDATGVLADRLAAEHQAVHALHRPGKSGLGPAYRAGFAWGMVRGFDAFCEMDADGSHDPPDLPRLLGALRGADLAIGSRYVPGGGVVDWPWHRRALSRGGNRYVQLATAMPVADATAGFRAYRRVVLEEIDLGSVRSDGYSFQLEMVLRTWRLGFRIVELPITFVERGEGTSKISRSIVIEALWRVPQWGIQGPRSPRPAHPRSVAVTG
ncbi:MAG: polyprenol monophosphomannose synthase [Egibacteraceae bacterium]